MLSCSKCSYDNESASADCEMCGCDVLISSAGGAATITCAKCTFLFSIRDVVCPMCQSSPPSGVKSLPASVLITKPTVVEIVDPPTVRLTTGQCDTQCVEGVVQAVSSRLTHRRASQGPTQTTLTSASPRDARYQFQLSSPTNYYSQRNAAGSKWSCGYRNIQMMISAIMRIRTYKDALLRETGGLVPTIEEIQMMIGAAWAAGFDTEGSQQLGGRLIGKSVWIGATECATFFSFHGIRAKLVDISGCEESREIYSNKWKRKKRKTEVRVVEPQETTPGSRMSDWVVDYFTNPKYQWSDDEGNSFLPPLYLQHDGHSRTIIGFEKDCPNLYLLILDPAKSATVIHESLFSATCTSNAWTKSIRVNLNSLQRQHAYQLVYLEEGIMNDSERNISKILTSSRI